MRTNTETDVHLASASINPAVAMIPPWSIGYGRNVVRYVTSGRGGDTGSVWPSWRSGLISIEADVMICLSSSSVAVQLWLDC